MKEYSARIGWGLLSFGFDIAPVSIFHITGALPLQKWNVEVMNIVLLIVTMITILIKLFVGIG